jgi:hypothetical protein
MNKKGFELASNMIVTLVLAFAVLGFGLFFIANLYNIKMDIPPKCDISPPTDSSPVCIANELTVKRSAQVTTIISVFNKESADIKPETKPSITCSTDIDGKELKLKVTSAGLNIPVNEIGAYNIVMQIPKDAPKSTFPCTFSVSSTQKQFSIIVQ